MLTFLRKIRRSFIDSVSSKGYMLYAIGEILLVMIGILLALQVNNWNASGAYLKSEHEFFINLQIDLLYDKEFTYNGSKGYGIKISRNSYIIGRNARLIYNNGIADDRSIKFMLIFCLTQPNISMT